MSKGSPVSPSVKEKRRLSKPISSVLAGSDPSAELRPLITADMVNTAFVNLVDCGRLLHRRFHQNTKSLKWLLKPTSLKLTHQWAVLERSEFTKNPTHTHTIPLLLNFGFRGFNEMIWDAISGGYHNVVFVGLGGHGVQELLISKHWTTMYK